MGMYVSLASLSEPTITKLHADPPLVWLVVAPDDPEAIAKARGAPKRPGLLARLFGARAETTLPPTTAGLVLEEGEGDVGSLDKAWHGIHYLLTGTAWEGDPPLNFLVSGGQEVGEEDVGYGPARTLTPGETREIAGALAAVSDDQLRARFAPGEMMRLEIYPEIWDRDPAEDDTLGYLIAYVGQLRAILASVVARGHGLLVAIT
jgi:hypothetical protein